MTKSNLRNLQKIAKRLSILSSLFLGVHLIHGPASARLLNESIQLSDEERITMNQISGEVSSSGTARIVDAQGFRLQRREYERGGLERDSVYYSKLLKKAEGLLSERDDIKSSACDLPYDKISDEEKIQSNNSCEELIAAAFCKFSYKADLKAKTSEHCNNFSELFEQTLERARKANVEVADNGFETNPYLAAVSHRCIFGFDIKELDRETTLQSCEEAYEIEKEKLSTKADPNTFSGNHVYGSHIASSTSYLNRIGFLYQEAGRHGDAIELVNSYLSFVEPLDLGKTIGGEQNYTDQAKVYALEVLGDVYARANEYSQAVESYKPILNNSSFENLIGLQEEEFRVHNKLATALLGDGQLKQAEEEFRLAIQNQEERGPNDLTYSRTGALRVQENNREAYDKLQALLIAQGKYEEALEITDRRRSFLFSGRFRDVNEVNPNNPNKRPEFTFKEIKQEVKKQGATFVVYSKSSFLLDSNGNGLDKAGDGKEYVNIWVVKPSGDLVFKNVSLDSALGVSSIAQLQSADNIWVPISRIALIISILSLGFLSFKAGGRSRNRSTYAIGSAASGLLLVSTFFIFSANVSGSDSRGSSSPQLMQMVSQTMDTTRGSGVSEVLANSTCSSSERCLKKMYQILIKPIQSDLPSKGGEEHIIFVPDEELNSISFAALTSSDNNYLIDDYVISSTPSLRAFNLLRLRSEKKQIKVSDNLVVGNPVMPEEQGDGFTEPIELSQLPYAEEEAKKVAKLLGTEALTGLEANEENVKSRLSQSNYIHLATHGLPNVYNPYLPSFALAASNTENPRVYGDGFLDTDEIYRTPLNGELAVLSACDTSSGRATVEGNLSLARPFLANGIPSVIASLWQVQDESTEVLMSYFYQSLEETPNKAVALRRAILATKDEYPDPRAWAGFMLIGLSETPNSSDSKNTQQVVGTISCSLKYYGGGINSNSRNITKATLEELRDGYQLMFTEEDGSQTFLELDSNLIVKAGGVIEAGTKQRVPFNLITDEPPFTNPLTISEDGTFDVGINSRRSICSVSGKLEFLGSTKSKLF